MFGFCGNITFFLNKKYLHRISVFRNQLLSNTLNNEPWLIRNDFPPESKSSEKDAVFIHKAVKTLNTFSISISTKNFLWNASWSYCTDSSLCCFSCRLPSLLFLQKTYMAVRGTQLMDETKSSPMKSWPKTGYAFKSDSPWRKSRWR